jgi:hypothetical protein
MKRLPIAAAALLLSSSAFAMIPSTAPTGVTVEKDPYAVVADAAVMPVHDDGFHAGMAALQPASEDWWGDVQPAAYAPHEAAVTNWAAEDMKADAMADEAVKADAVVAEEAAAPAPEAQTIAYTDDAAYADEVGAEDAGAPVETAANTGVGGPYEGVDPVAADLTPRAAAQNYPACRPGPGDDHCIQLYEPGVEQRLAAWSQPTGGFAGSADTQVAMGGPYEGADEPAIAEEETAMADMPADDALAGL